MFNRLKNLIAAPVFADEEATRLAGLLTVILRATFVAALVLTSTLTLLEPGSDPLPRLATGAVAAIMILGLFVLMRTGRVRLVSVLLPLGLLAVVTASVAQFGDIQGPVVAGYYVVIVVAGLLLGARGSFVFTLFSMLAMLGVLLMSVQGAPLNSPAVVTELQAWFVHAGLFSVTAVLLSLAAGNIREGLENARRLFAEMQRRAEELERLNDLTRAALETADLPQLLQMLADRMGKLVNADGCFITLWDEARQATIPAAASSLMRERYRAMQLERGELTMTESVLRAGHVLVAEDVFHTPYMSPHVAAQFPTRSLLGLPLIAAGQKLGAALIGFNQPHHFTPDEIALGEQVARQIALAVAKARALEAERRRAAQLSLLEEASRQVAGTLDEQEIFRRTVTAIVNRFGFAEAAISLPIGGDQLELVAITGTEDLGFTPGFRQKVGEGIIGHVAETRAIYLTNDVGQDGYYFSSPGRQVGSALGLPMLREEQLMGVLYVESSSSDAFDTDDVRTLETLANHIATALQNARLYARARDRLRELSTLQSVSHTVASSLELSQIFQTVVQLLQDTFGYHYVSIYLLDGEVLRLGAQVGYPTELIYSEIPIATGVTGRAVRTRQTQFVRDVTADPIFLLASHDLGSEICVPLLQEQIVLGILNVEAARDRPLTEADVDLLAALAGPVTVAIDNARLFESERKQRVLAEALRETSTALSERLDFEAVLDRLLDQIARVIAYDTAHVMLVEGGRTRTARMRGYEQFGEEAAHGIAGLSFEIAATPNLRQMAETGKPLVIPDTAAFPGWVRVEAAAHIRSWAGAPIMAQGQMIALFALGKTERNFYRSADAECLAAFAAQVTLALQNAQLFEQTQRRAAQLSALNEIGRAVSTLLDVDSILEVIYQQVQRNLPLDVFFVSLYDAEANTVSNPFVVDGGQRYQEPLRPLIEDSHTGRTLRTAAPQLINCTPEELAAKAHHHHGIGDRSRPSASLLFAPLLVGLRVIGVISAQSYALQAYTDEHLALLMGVASQAAIAIENARLFEAEERRAKMLAALHATSLDITFQHDLPTLLRTIVERAAQLIGAPSGGLYLCDLERQEVRCMVSYRTWRDYTGTVLKYGEGMAGRVAQSGQPLMIDDYRTWSGRATVFEGQPFTAVLSVPMIWQGRVTGIIDLEYTAEMPGRFTPADLELLTLFASQAAIAVENARLFEAEEHRAEMLAALHATLLDLTLQHDLPILLRIIVERAARLIGAASGGLYLADPDRQEVRYVVSYQTRRDYSGTVLKYGEGASGRVAQTGQPLIIDDYRTWSGRASVYENQPFTAVIAVPMIWQGKVTGVITAEHYWDAPGYFTPADLELLTLFANQAAIAVENARLLTETRRRAEEQRLLYNAARDFMAGLSEEAVLQAIARRLGGALEAAGCAVSLWEPAQDRVVTLLDYDAGDGLLLDRPGESYALAEYPATRRVLEGQQPVVVRADDPEADPAECVLLNQRGNATVLMLPLGAGEDVFGLIELTRRAGAPRFSESDVRLGQSLTVEAGVALENARLHTIVQERVRELDALLTANTAMLSTLELEPLLDNILRAALAAIPAAEKGTVLLTATAEMHDAAEPSEPRLQIRALSGYTDPRVQTFAFAGSEGYSAKAVREKRPLLIRDAQADPEVCYTGDIPEVRAILSAIAVPLMHHDHPLGVISLDATRRAAFTEADLRLLLAFANTAAVAIDNARLHAEVRALAVTDGLTSLANLRAFTQALEAEIARAGRYGYPVSLVFLDIDSFKLYNDTYGHPAGNERLKAIAALLRERVREPDLAARYGGEEFALLLPHTPKEGALRLAERIRAAAEASAPKGHAPGVPVSGYTLSLGVAAFPDDARTPPDLLLAADRAEITAKRAGKNYVVAATALTAR